MKKLITLLLVLTGMVSTASADFKVYIYPGTNWGTASPKFSMYMFNATTNEWADFTAVTGYSGFYEATFKTTYTSLIVVRHSGEAANTHTFDGKWTQSTNLSPTLSTLYDFGSSGTDGSSAQAPSGTRPLGSWVMFGNRHITAHNDNWYGTSTYNTMSLKAGSTHTYELTVEGKAVKDGTYGYKFKGNGTYDVGDISQVGWPNLELSISDGDGYYNIKYTLDELTLEASAVATKQSDATLTYKYFVYDYDPDYSPVGISNITGQRWWLNEMTDDNSDGTYTFSVNGKNLTSGTKYGFKVQEQVYDGSSAIEGYNCLLNTNDLSTDEGYKTITPSKNRAYNVTFSVTPSANNYEMSASNFGITANAIETGYYIINSYGGWHVGDIMTESSGTYSATLSGFKGYYFLILPANKLSEWEGSTWTNVIRPSENKEDFGFENLNGTTITGGENSWKISSSNDANITINFTPGTSTWSIAPYIEREIKAVASNYATFSSAYNVAIPANVTAKYTKSITAGVIAWTDIENGIPANEGALLHATAAGTYKFTPATSTDDLTGNLMLPIATTSQLKQVTETGYTNFILSKVSEVLGFYKPAADPGSYCGAGTAYLHVPNGSLSARGFFSLDDETTSIEVVKKEQKMNGECYNLAGQRVAQPTKGLYIVNGKKVIVK